MWLPIVNFITIHYAYILSCTILAFIVIYPYGNLRAIDAFFFAASANTESGLNTVDVKALKLYQQLVIYFFPIITNLGVINIIVVVVRLRYFEKYMKSKYPSIFKKVKESAALSSHTITVERNDDGNGDLEQDNATAQAKDHDQHGDDEAHDDQSIKGSEGQRPGTTITWASDTARPPRDTALKIPSPRDREKGVPISEVSAHAKEVGDDGDSIELAPLDKVPSHSRGRSSRSDHAGGYAIERAVSSAFVLGGESSSARHRSISRSRRHSTSTTALDRLPQLSDQVTIGRNSTFHNMTPRDRAELGGVEYRSLRLLLKIVIGYEIGLHLFGALCLAPWIVNAPAKYREYLASQGQGQVWWAFYSSQTMINNLGFTLTPDSMISFRDATWPLLVMSFLAFAGNTCYPIFLRCSIWMSSQVARFLERRTKNDQKRASLKSTLQSLQFLLDHPRRCYTLLFPSNVTWALFGILFLLNFLDTLIIVVCDLHNAEVASLPAGPRVLAAIFQAASSRHTGTADFNLAKVSPAVQFSLLIMMYVSVFPVAISVRASNTYEERSLGTYAPDPDMDEGVSSATYLMNHARGQLGFDLWYIFLGTFCICIAEAGPIADPTNLAFNVFAILFEVTSAYANVGLSLGTNATLTSLCGDFHTFSKLVICAMMIRGRHRGLPYALDRSIMLPGERLEREEAAQGERAREWEEVGAGEETRSTANQMALRRFKSA